MTQLVPFLLICFSIFRVYGQKLRVLEKESQFPIDRVLVYNESKNIYRYTDKNGYVDISVFKDTDWIKLQHIAYINQRIYKKDLEKKHYILYLESNSEQIPEVVLSVSKDKEKRNRIAEQIEVITSYQIRQKAPQTSADLLAQTPGVKVQKSQFGGGSPVLRGMESNRVLLVVDGVRMNNAIYRKGHLQNSITVSPNLLSRTEVLFGPSSIMYGSDALGGVIHYYTKKPKISEAPYFNSDILTRYSSVNNELTLSYSGEYSNKKWGSLTAVSVSKFGDLEMGKNRTHGFNDWGLVPYYSDNTTNYYTSTPVVNPNSSIQKNTGYRQIDLLQKFVFPLSKRTALNFNLQYSNSSDIPRFDKLNEYRNNQLRYAEWYYGPQKRLLAASQLNIKPGKKWLKNGQIILAYQDINESRQERKFNSLQKLYRSENVKVWSLNADFHVPMLSKQKRILSYGIETSYNKISSQAIGKTLAVSGNDITGFSNTFAVQSRFPDGGSSYANIAFYTDYRLDHTKKGTLNLGLRYTHTLLKAKWLDTTFITLPKMQVHSSNAAFSGTLAYIYKPNHNWRLSSVLSSGFRSPNIDDLGKIREKRGKVSVPNTHLKPEYAYNAELGIFHKFNPKSWIGFTTYYTLLHQYINRDAFNLDGQNSLLYDGEWASTIANVNKGNAYIIGGTFSMQTQLYKQLKFKTSATYTKGATYDTAEPLSSIPPLFGDGSLTYQIKKWDFGLEYRFNLRKKATDYNVAEGIDNIEETPIINPDATDKTVKYYGTPTWHTFHFTSSVKLNRLTHLNLHIDNIFDIHYKEFASGVSAPGRNLSLSVQTQF